MDEFKGVQVMFMNNVFSIGAIFRIIYEDDVALSEGDVINIEPAGDFPKANLDWYNFPPDVEFTHKVLEILFGRFSYNLTFLIELDPL